MPAKTSPWAQRAAEAGGAMASSAPATAIAVRAERRYRGRAAMSGLSCDSNSEREVLVGDDRGDVHLRLLQAACVVPVHRLPAGELVEHPHARLARAVARLAVAAEGQVRLGPRRRVVDADHAGGHALAEAHRVLGVGRVDRAAQAVAVV